jgi:hypothetical protein
MARSRMQWPDDFPLPLSVYQHRRSDHFPYQQSKCLPTVSRHANKHRAFHLPWNPFSLRNRIYFSLTLHPAMQPTYRATFRRRFSGNGFRASISEIATLPPRLSSRLISAKTAGFSASGTRFMTQLEMMQSAMPASSGTDVILPSTNETLPTSSDLAWLLRARSSIS